jgi:hypothetical protein
LRALVGATLPTDDDRGLIRLAAIERAVFGAASRDDGHGADDAPRWQSAVALRTRGQVPFVVAGPRAPWMTGDGTVAYLLGQGLWSRDPATRDWILAGHVEPGSAIRLAIRIDPRAPKSASVADLFCAALWALATFGGLGSRARRGFGTIEVTRPPNLPTSEFKASWFAASTSVSSCASIPDTIQHVLRCVASAVSALGIAEDPAEHAPLGPPDAGTTPRYPCFRPGAYELGDRTVAGARPSDFGRALAETGRTLREFRTDGDDRTRTYEYEDLIRPWLNHHPPDPAEPFAIGALGLPVVFTRKSDGASGTVAPRVGDAASEELRRASPLWLRLYPDSTGRWHLRSLALLAEWLPETAQLWVRGKDGTRPPAPLGKPTADAVNDLIRRWFQLRPTGL